MAATKKRFSCGHKGYGEYCHRCAQAEALEQKANSLKASQTPSEGDKKGKGKKATSEDVTGLLEEAKRLRGPQKKSKRDTVSFIEE